MNYDKKIEKNIAKNQVLLDAFEDSMINEGISEKTINTHVSNIDFYINDYLNCNNVITAEKGINHIDDFLGDWFIRKAMWSYESSIKQNITSLKKFYKFMVGEGLINNVEFDFMLQVIKDNKDFWILSVNKYNDALNSDDLFNDELMFKKAEDALKSFYREVKAFGKLKPWTWLSDIDIFGIYNEETLEYYFICVLGEAKESYGVIIYEELDGLKSYFKQLNGEFDDPREVIQAVEAIGIHFENKSNLEPEDLEMIAESGEIFKGKNQWPLVRVYEPGFLPVVIEPCDMSNMSEILEIAREMAVLFKKEPQRLTNLQDNQIYIREISIDGTFRDVFKTYKKLFMPLDTEISVPVYVNELDLKRAKKFCKRTLDVWEIETFYNIEPVESDEYEEPFFPAMILIANAENGMIIGQHLAHPDKQDEDFQLHVLQMINKLKEIPKKVYIKNERAILLLLPIFDVLKVEIIPKKKLETISNIKRNLFNYKDKRNY